MKKTIKIALIALISIVLFIPFAHFQNNHIVTTEITFSRKPNTRPIRIAHLSDLQCKTFKSHQSTLIDKVTELHPDLIVFTGDIVDAFHYDDQSWRAMARNLPAIAPTYFVSGNHEWWNGNFEEVEAELTKYGIQVLRNKTVSLIVNARTLTITGVDDPEAWKGDNKIYLHTINQLSQELPKQALSLLLVHRPEHFNDYDKTSFQMVFAGHAHGGQFRLPFIGGLLSPNQGALPKFTSGLYEGENTKMIVSRGLGNSIFPLRLFN